MEAWHYDAAYEMNCSEKEHSLICTAENLKCTDIFPSVMKAVAVHLKFPDARFHLKNTVLNFIWPFI